MISQTIPIVICVIGRNTELQQKKPCRSKRELPLNLKFEPQGDGARGDMSFAFQAAPALKNKTEPAALGVRFWSVAMPWRSVVFGKGHRPPPETERRQG